MKLCKQHQLIAILIMVLLVMGCSSEKTAQKEGSLKGEYITILTGGSSGVYFPLGGTLAKLYQEKLSAVATSQSTAASAENATKLNQKKAEVGFLMGDTALDAYKGIDSFEQTGAQKNLRSIAALYPNYLQIATIKNRNITSITELKGKRLAVGAPGSGTEISAKRVLEAYDMTYDDVKVDYLSFAEGIDGMKNGTVDAVVISSGIPNSGLLELATTEEVVILEIEEENIHKINGKYPSFFSTIIPEGTYAGQEQDVNTIGVYNVLLTHKDVSENTVYLMTKTMFEHIEELKDTHHAAKDIDVNKARENLPAPLHPGAEKYFTELNSK
ncbi:TAXI family TRAP transporter solute-binding subunit [Bacillus aquiflavi]|uniref:TAXI family TRAP transporter solute-binding subunit n=1 Tax=Bacillus aquiflavi TaxID=2672567 RepID=A0A6B3VZ93_9BACI|nr:TAXI family TRAP transporter solute-binding subunit [Bacillus aquiflavi]MBA4536306.1 TAXI family TRAP transporter solute-binding subunit [Bacillus aquiflavi]NEY80674.1 TAXI family TRAP transporter solute-binding subunit [Bacillus aquiflavi]UAC48857.1 TAXI family TRAP transporter solute-binding subunit [Bacillus aquiflavi]